MKTIRSKQLIRGSGQAGCVVLALLVVLGATLLILVSGYFRQSSETRALKEAVAATLNQSPQKRVHLNAGWFTAAAARAGAHLIEMPEEARVALGSVRGVEVGVYQLPDSTRAKPGLALTAADKRMTTRGWERAVGVVDGQEVVAVYVPSGKISPKRIKVCVMVLSGRELVVATARGNLEELMDLASKKLKEHTGGVIPMKKNTRPNEA